MCLLLLQIPRNKYKTNLGRNHYKYYAGTIIALYCILQLQFPCIHCICILGLAPRCCEHLSSLYTFLKPVIVDEVVKLLFTSIMLTCTCIQDITVTEWCMKAALRKYNTEGRRTPGFLKLISCRRRYACVCVCLSVRVCPPPGY